MTTDGTVIASIAAGVCTDAAGNGNAASTSTDNTVTWFTAIQIDTSAVSAQFVASPATLSLTVANNYNRGLVVYVTFGRGGAGTTISTVTWNSGSAQTLTRVAASAVAPGGGYKGEIWYLDDPNTGAGTITVTFAAAPSNGAKVCAVSLYNVAFAGTPAGGSGFANDTAPTLNITTVANNSMIVHGLSGRTANPTINSWGAGQTEFANWGFLTSVPWSAGSYKILATAGATTMTASLAVAQNWYASAMEVQLAP
jgi:hypothetical protein